MSSNINIHRFVAIFAIQLSLGVAYAGQGIEADGTIYFDDEGWTGSWNYICLSNHCVPGEKVDGRWERRVSGLVAGQTYCISLKVQDNATGQYLSPVYCVVAGEGEMDAGVDAGVDSGIDAGVDSGIDAGADSGIDAAIDSGIDAGVDSGIDAAIDSGIDAAVDSGIDAAVDSGIDATTDFGVDVGPTDLGHLDWTSNSLLSGKGVGAPPRQDPIRALATPVNGAQPTSHGFAFDISGSILTWRWGPQIVKGSGDSGLQMHCSEDGIVFRNVSVVSGQATIPCSGEYDYFFRYEHPSGSVNDNPAYRWIYTGLFTTEGPRVNPNAYPSFTEGSSNWMRWRQPLSGDGIESPVLDAIHNSGRMREVDRYLIQINDSPGNVELELGLNGSTVRVESMRRGSNSPNTLQFFGVNTNPGFGNLYSYGQVIEFLFVALAGTHSAQTYSNNKHYTVGYGWSAYGDPRLKPAGRAGTTMTFADGNGFGNELEKDAIFTQQLVTLHSEQDIDDFILGHHLFHGIDPNRQGSTTFGEVKIGSRACGDCHFRDGRGFEIFQTAKGPRIAPPIFGLGLLDAIAGRQAGFTWDGSTPTLLDQVGQALINDHGVNPGDVPGRVVELLEHYTKVVTVPNRDPGSYDQPGVAEGDQLFNQIGCADCHMPIQTTSSNNLAFDKLTIRPYTDMRTWFVNGGTFRTAPLWGLGHNIELLSRNGHPLRLMHDGSATNVDQAIQLHDGDAATVRDRYNALSASDRQNIVNFVETL